MIFDMSTILAVYMSLVPRGFFPQGKLFFCPQDFVPQGKLFVVRPHPWILGVFVVVVPRVSSPQGRLFFFPWGFLPHGKLGRHRWCRACQGVVPRGLVPQGNLGRRRWCRACQRVLDGNEEAKLGHTSITANDTVQLMKADVRWGLYTILPARGRRADVSDIYWIALISGTA